MNDILLDSNEALNELIGWSLATRLLDLIFDRKQQKEKKKTRGASSARKVRPGNNNRNNYAYILRIIKIDECK